MKRPPVLPTLDTELAAGEASTSSSERENKIVFFDPQLRLYCLTAKGELSLTVLRQLLQARHLSSVLSGLGQDPHHASMQLHPMLKATTSANGAAEAGKLTFTLLSWMLRALIAEAWDSVEQVAGTMEHLGIQLRNGASSSLADGGGRGEEDAAALCNVAQGLMRPLQKLAALQDLPVTVLGKLPLSTAQEICMDDIQRLVAATRHVYSTLQDAASEIGSHLENLCKNHSPVADGFASKWLEALHAYFKLLRGLDALWASQGPDGAQAARYAAPQPAAALLQERAAQLARCLFTQSMASSAAAADGCLEELRRLSLCLCNGNRWAAGCRLLFRGTEPVVEAGPKGGPKELIPVLRALPHVLIGAPAAVEWSQTAPHLMQVDTLEAAVSGARMHSEAAALASGCYVALLQELRALAEPADGKDALLDSPRGYQAWRQLDSDVPVAAAKTSGEAAKWAVAVIEIRQGGTEPSDSSLQEKSSGVQDPSSRQDLEELWGAAMASFHETSRKEKPAISPEAGRPESGGVQYTSRSAACILDALRPLLSKAGDGACDRCLLCAGSWATDAVLRMATVTTQAAVNWVCHAQKLFPSGATTQGLCLVHSDSLQIADKADELYGTLARRAGCHCSPGPTPQRGACVGVGELQLLDRLKEHVAALRLATARLQDFLGEKFNEAAHTLWSLSITTMMRYTDQDGPSAEAQKVKTQLLEPLEAALRVLDRRSALALFPLAVCAVLHEAIAQTHSALDKSRCSPGAAGRQLRRDLALVEGMLEAPTKPAADGDATNERLQVLLEPGELQAARPVLKRARLISELLMTPMNVMNNKGGRTRHDWKQLPDASKWKALRRGR